MAEPPSQDELKRRIHAARLIRGLSQKALDQMAAADGYGKGEMGRVERGELDFRPGKHIEPLCRYLDVPRWWFEAERLEFPHETTDNERRIRKLLEEQSKLLREIQALIGADAKITLQDHLAQMIRDAAARAGPGPER